ncbi:MAG: NAD(P)H-hydrate dehydratase [Sphingobacteriaceae bacterium]
MFILNKDQLTFADEYTIQNEPIESIQLMERAARACVLKLLKRIDDSNNVAVFCGKGNNGGDGLAIARMLAERGYQCKAYVINYTPNFSADCKTNFEKLKAHKPDCLIEINSEEELKKIELNPNVIIIDALLGTGTNKPLSGLLASTVNLINATACQVISIDCPSGIYIDKANDKDDVIVHSSLTLTFQYPKLSFLMAQNRFYVPHFEVLDIGLHHDLEKIMKPNLFFVTKQTIKQILSPRPKFAHKGNFGHALILAGSDTMRGAALISAKACLKGGAGLLTVHSTEKVIDALTPYLPEAMSSIDENKEYISNLPELTKYDAIAIGPGLGIHIDTQAILKKLLHYNNASLVLDADALNILSENKTWLAFLPIETVLTPHPKEFDRLTQEHENDFERLRSAQQFSLNNKCILVLKGTYTVICMPDGSCYFNSSGNSGLAKGGSGDTLTGIITGLIARGYTPAKAALIGVFVHGYAADLCIKKSSKESLLATEVIDKLDKAFYKLEKEEK